MLMENCSGKYYPASFTSYAQTFPPRIPIWIWQGKEYEVREILFNTIANDVELYLRALYC